jgi:hypothetical protein
MSIVAVLTVPVGNGENAIFQKLAWLQGMRQGDIAPKK